MALLGKQFLGGLNHALAISTTLIALVDQHAAQPTAVIFGIDALPTHANSLVANGKRGPSVAIVASQMAASIRDRIALGERAGQKGRKLGSRRECLYEEAELTGGCSNRPRWILAPCRYQPVRLEKGNSSEQRPIKEKRTEESAEERSEN